VPQGELITKSAAQTIFLPQILQQKEHIGALEVNRPSPIHSNFKKSGADPRELPEYFNVAQTENNLDNGHMPQAVSGTSDLVSNCNNFSQEVASSGLKPSNAQGRAQVHLGSNRASAKASWQTASTSRKPNGNAKITASESGQSSNANFLQQPGAHN